jgi:Holliday junction resolvase RusA-like endonuclease
MMILLPIRPVAKQSYRATKTGFGYQSATVKKFKKEVQAMLPMGKFKRPFFANSALTCEIVFEFKETAGNIKKCKVKDSDGKRYKTTRPDLDNLCKAILDAMNGIIFDDDSAIVELKCKKLLAENDYITIKIEAMI